MIDGMLKSCSNSLNRYGICRFADAKQKNRQHLSLNSIEDSQEESASPRFEIHLQQCYNQPYFLLIHYTKRKNRNRVQENSAVFFAKQKNRQHKSLCGEAESSGIFEEFLYNFLTGRDFNTATLIKFFKIYIKFIITSESRSYKRICDEIICVAMFMISTLHYLRART